MALATPLRSTILAKGSEFYEISDEDDSNATPSAGTQYFGYLNTSGKWIIQQGVPTGNTVAWRYIQGSSDYATNWSNRTALVYALYSTLFTVV